MNLLPKEDIMNEKEISEIRRTLSCEKNNITSVRGCYVNTTGEIIAEFQKSAALMPEDETEKYLSIFRRTLSGTVEKNLLKIDFSNEQVLNGAEYKLLADIKNNGLEDEESVKALYAEITASLKMKQNYVILLTHNKYDVPYRSKDGGTSESNEVFTYLLCSICPVKVTKANLKYDATEKAFINNTGDCAIASPELGFLFPCFDDRRTNIYSSLFYTKDTDNAYGELTDALFKSNIEMPADEQGQTFRSVLAGSLDADCSFNVAKEVHHRICEKIEEHKLTKDPEPLTVSKYQVKDILSECGVPAEKLDAFTEEFDRSFGQTTDLSPKNIIDHKKFELKTPDVVIKVAPGHDDLVDTRIIDGTKYILIRADEGVELNGLNVKIR